MEVAVGLEPSEVRSTISLINFSRPTEDNSSLLNADASNMGSTVTESSGSPFVVCTEEELSKDLLMDALRGYSYWVLCVSGFIWKDPDGIRNFFLCIWNVALFSAASAFSIGAFLSLFMTRHTATSHYVLLCAVVVQSIGVSVGTVLNVRRLRRKYYNDQVVAFNSAQKSTWLSILIAFTGMFTIPAIDLSLKNTVTGLVFIICIPSVVQNGINIQFVLADSNLARCLVRDLVQKVRKGESVSLLEIKCLRNKVHRIVDESFYATTAVMLAALSNLLCLFVLVVFVDRSNVVLVLFQSCLFLFKEIIFAIVGLYFASLVNEAAAELTWEIGEKLTYVDLNSFNDSRQMSFVLHSLQACPIQFPIVGMVLKRKDVALRVGLWVFSVLLSLFAKIIH
jgi:hypothetical protein